MQVTNYFDLFVGTLILFLALKGVISGFVKEVFGLIGVVGGIFLAFRYGDSVGVKVDEMLYHFDSQGAVSLAGFAVTLFGVWIIAVIIGFMINRLISISGLGVIDRLLGFIVGGAKIFLLFSVIVYSLAQIEIVKINTAQYVKDSFFYPLFITTGEYLVKLNPNELTKDFYRKDENLTIKTGESNSSE